MIEDPVVFGKRIWIFSHESIGGGSDVLINSEYGRDSFAKLSFAGTQVSLEGDYQWIFVGEIEVFFGERGG